MRELPPAVAVKFRLPSGEVLQRSWWMGDDIPDLTEIPGWLANPRKRWVHPQDPITYLGDVKPGREDEARQFVGDPTTEETS